jgi:hypothetical protein
MDLCTRLVIHGNEWWLVGYTQQKINWNRSHIKRNRTYRCVCIELNARVRILSSQPSRCQISRANAERWFNVPYGTNQMGEGTLAKTFEQDIAKAKLVRQRHIEWCERNSSWEENQ